MCARPSSPSSIVARERPPAPGTRPPAWSADLFAGSESSDDPAGSKKSFGDVWVATYRNPGGHVGATTDDGKEFVRSEIVVRGSSAPFPRGVFHDKTSTEVDPTGGSCDGNVYFAWSRFTNDNSNIYLARSTDHGATWSHPRQLTTSVKDVQFPEVTVTHNGHVYVTYVAMTGNSTARRTPSSTARAPTAPAPSRRRGQWSPSRAMRTRTAAAGTAAT